MDIFKELIPALTSDKRHLLLEDANLEKSYNPYIVNLHFSQGKATLPIANEMNKSYTLDKRLQFDFYFHMLPKGKLYQKWYKKEEINKIELVQEYFGYSFKKAREALQVLTDEQLSQIERKLYKGEVSRKR